MHDLTSRLTLNWCHMEDDRVSTPTGYPHHQGLLPTTLVFASATAAFVSAFVRILICIFLALILLLIIMVSISIVMSSASIW